MCAPRARVAELVDALP